MILDVGGLRGIDHVGLTVPDLEQAIAFFTGVFGATVLFRHGAYAPDAQVNVQNFARPASIEVAGIAMIRIGDRQIELLAYRGGSGQEMWPATSDLGGYHLSFYVEDLDSAVTALRAAGVEVLGDPLPMGGPESGPGNRFVYLRAPWGMFLELVTYPRGKAVDRG